MPPKNVRPFRPTLLRLEDRTTPSAGALDPTFGVGGRVSTRLPYWSNDSGRAVTIDHHGRIVIASQTHNGRNYDFAVTRLTPAGALDTTLGGTGVVFVDFNFNDDIANAVAVDSLDRIVIAGTTTVFGGSNFAVARLTALGALDTSFDGDGKQTINISPDLNEAFGVAVDSMNRVVVVGRAHFANDDMAVARLTPAGALDTSFSFDGKFTFQFGSYEDIAYAVAVDSQDRVVVAGYVDRNDGTGPVVDFAVARLTVAGGLDGAFDGDGRQTIDFGSNSDYAFGVAVDSQDRVAVAGYTYNGSNNDIAVARLTVGGAPDNSFDGDGKQAFAFGAADDVAQCVAIDSLDRVLIAGYTSNGSNNDFAVARLTGAGALDPTFDGDGKQTVAFGAANDTAYGLVTDSVDRALIAGFADNGSNSDVALCRLTTTGVLDTNLDADGKETLELNARSQAMGRAVTVDGLGRTVVAGDAFDGTNYVFAVARYTTTGALDSTFGLSGIVQFSFGTALNAPFGVAVDSLGRVLVASTAWDGTNNDFAVARLTPAGALDPSFDADGKQTIDFGTLYDYGQALAIDSQDRVVVAGYTYSGIAVARLTTAGALDNSFDSDGKQTVSFAPSSAVAYGVAIDSHNRIVIAGTIGYHDGIAVARLTAGGALDSSFDGDGKQTIQFSSYAQASAVAVDSQDRIVIAGSTGTAFSDFAVARLTSAGALDSNFDGDGKLTIAFGTADDYGYGVKVDSLDRVIVAGSTSLTTSTDFDFAVARLTTTGALDNSFDGDGKQTVNFGGFHDVAYAVALNRAGQIIAAGYSGDLGEIFSIARLTGDSTTALAQVNDGSAQRSRVTSLTVRFSSQVTFNGSPDQAFTLTRNGGGSVSFTATVSMQNGGTVVLLDHFTGSETEFGSLADGRYTLTALSSQISAGGQALDGDADGTAGGNFVFNDMQGLFRMFGDVNGDQTVNGLDLGFFRNAFGTQTGDPNYLSYLDLNGDGVINGFDLGQFRTRFGTMLP